DPCHRNVARTLSNLASVKRLIALQLLHKIDAEAARRRKAATRGRSRPEDGKAPDRNRFEQLRSEAVAELDEAQRIYEQYRNHHGLGSVHLNGGYLHLDSGELEHADSEARTAFHLGEEKGDYILMARARLLDCMIENGRVEEEIGDGGEADSHARLAQDCIQEAVELARHTQNRRLLGDACIWQGLTYCNRFLDDPESAPLLRRGHCPRQGESYRRFLRRSRDPENKSSARRAGESHAPAPGRKDPSVTRPSSRSRNNLRTLLFLRCGNEKAARYPAWRAGCPCHPRSPPHPESGRSAKNWPELMRTTSLRQSSRTKLP